MTKDGVRPADREGIEREYAFLERRKIVEEGDNMDANNGVERRLANLGYL